MIKTEKEANETLVKHAFELVQPKMYEIVSYPFFVVKKAHNTNTRTLLID